MLFIAYQYNRSNQSHVIDSGYNNNNNSGYQSINCTQLFPASDCRIVVQHETLRRSPASSVISWCVGGDKEGYTQKEKGIKYDEDDYYVC